MTTPPRPPRKLHVGHFPFMRAVVQGLDAQAMWERYLRIEGEASDLRVVRSTIRWICDAFAVAARREQRPGTARLVLLDAADAPPEAFALGMATPAADAVKAG